MTGILGFFSKSLSSGVPQIVVQVPECISFPGVITTKPLAPYSCTKEVSAGLPNPQLREFY